MARRASKASNSRSSCKGENAANNLPSVNDIAAANKIVFEPANPRQRLHMKHLRNYQLTVAVGPAGAGKTYVTTNFIAAGILHGTIKKAILMRPPVALKGTKHETLPGDGFAKVAPWAQPMLKKLSKMIGKERLIKMIKDKDIEVLPFTYLRGDEFEAGTFVMLDEAQNCDYEQIKAFTTRIADGATICICGDVTQTDRDMESGLEILCRIIDGSADLEVGMVEYLHEDIKRGKLCAQFVKAWATFEKAEYYDALHGAARSDAEAQGVDLGPDTLHLH